MRKSPKKKTVKAEKGKMPLFAVDLNSNNGHNVKRIVKVRE